eukprot:COSAG02_NODE_7496_length_2986_cov_25.448563_3_plen_425_part_00
MDVPERGRRQLYGISRALCTATSSLPAAPLTDSKPAVDGGLEALRGKAVAPLQGSVDGPFSDEDLHFWAENGYVVLKDAVPEELTHAVVDDIFDFLGKDRCDDDSWYNPYRVPEGTRPPHNAGGMVPTLTTILSCLRICLLCFRICAALAIVDQDPHHSWEQVEMYQTQSLWNTRQYPKVHAAFAQIWGTEDLWVSNDRASMIPPTRKDKPDWDYDGFMHWDTDVRSPEVKFAVQGVLYLEDTPANAGGFQCIPGFVRRYEDWHKALMGELRIEQRKGEGENISSKDILRKVYGALEELQGTEGQSIPGKRGSLLIWHSFLAHGNCRNASANPRLAQYITMFPSPSAAQEAGGRYSTGGGDPGDTNLIAQTAQKERENRIAAWQKTDVKNGVMGSAPGDAREEAYEAKLPAASLTPLGKKLLYG